MGDGPVGKNNTVCTIYYLGFHLETELSFVSITQFGFGKFKPTAGGGGGEAKGVNQSFKDVTQKTTKTWHP